MKKTLPLLSLIVILLVGFVPRVTAKPAGLTITQYPLNPSETASDIAAGPDGNVWFISADLSSRYIAKITPTGSITRFTIAANPTRLIAGPDGNIWFINQNTLGRMTVLGSATLFSPAAGETFTDLTAGPDGNVWVIGSQAFRVDPSGTITAHFPDGAGAAITAGADGNLWAIFPYNSPFYGNNTIKRITPSGAITYFATDPGYALYGIGAGPDGNVWFVRYTPGIDYFTIPSRYGRITLCSGVITEFPPASPFEIQSSRIVGGSDGGLWSFSNGRYGFTTLTRTSTDGTVDHPLGSWSGYVRAMTSGPDGKIWFIQSGLISTFDPRDIYGTHSTNTTSTFLPFVSR